MMKNRLDNGLEPGSQAYFTQNALRILMQKSRKIMMRKRRCSNSLRVVNYKYVPRKQACDEQMGTEKFHVKLGCGKRLSLHVMESEQERLHFLRSCKENGVFEPAIVPERNEDTPDLARRIVYLIVCALKYLKEKMRSYGHVRRHGRSSDNYVRQRSERVPNFSFAH